MGTRSNGDRRQYCDPIVVNFTHPRFPDVFEAQVGPATTGAQAVQGLVASKFLDGPTPTEPYALMHTRTGHSIPLTASLQRSGIEANDTVAVLQIDVGAAA